jgi:hypothetical protein
MALAMTLLVYLPIPIPRDMTIKRFLPQVLLGVPFYISVVLVLAGSLEGSPCSATKIDWLERSRGISHSFPSSLYDGRNLPMGLHKFHMR